MLSANDFTTMYDILDSATHNKGGGDVLCWTIEIDKHLYIGMKYLCFLMSFRGFWESQVSLSLFSTCVVNYQKYFMAVELFMNNIISANIHNYIKILSSNCWDDNPLPDTI